MSRERGRLVRDALHQAAIAGDEPGVVVDDGMSRLVERCRERAFGKGEADGVGHALAERAGRCLHAWRMSDLGMPRCPAVPLAELPDLVEREVVPRQEQGTVEQHGGVTGRQDKAVAVLPLRIGGGVAQMPRKEHVCERGKRHRRAGVTRFRGLDRIHGECTDGIDGDLVEIESDGSGHGPRLRR